MGVKFDRILDACDGPFETITNAAPPPGRVLGPPRPVGYLVSHHQNDAFILLNRLLRVGGEVYWPRDRTVGRMPDSTGAMYIPAKGGVAATLENAATELGLTVTGVSAKPAGGALKLRPVRIGLWDRYGGAAASGWTRWILERFGFPFEVVYAQTLDAGDLAKRFDVIVLTTEAIPLSARQTGEIRDLPPEYRGTTGALTWAKTVPQLKQFVEAGGTLITIGASTTIAQRLGVPIDSALVAKQGDGTERPLRPAEYYIPGSILRVSVDNTTPLAYGFERQVDVFFDNSPVFRIRADAGASSPRRVAWFAGPAPLRSGWAWGQQHLDGGVAVVDAALGKGRVLVFGPEILYRAQPHGTFKFLFNGIFYSKAEAVQLP
jgi:hypothetical protein